MRPNLNHGEHPIAWRATLDEGTFLTMNRLSRFFRRRIAGGLPEQTDGRGRRLVLVIECLLNQNARDLGAARYPGLNAAVVALCARHGAGILQMPCPEIRLLGPGRVRPPGVGLRDSVDSPAGRLCCGEISREVMQRVLAYREAGVRLVAVLGGNPESPGCAVRADVGGEGALPPASGLLMRALAKDFAAAGIDAPFRGIRDSRPDWMEADLAWLEERLRA